MRGGKLQIPFLRAPTNLALTVIPNWDRADTTSISSYYTSPTLFSFSHTLAHTHKIKIQLLLASKIEYLSQRHQKVILEDTKMLQMKSTTTSLLCERWARQRDPTLNIMTKTGQPLSLPSFPLPSLRLRGQGTITQHCRDDSRWVGSDVVARRPESVGIKIDGAGVETRTSGSSAEYGLLEIPYKLTIWVDIWGLYFVKVFCSFFLISTDINLSIFFFHDEGLERCCRLTEEAAQGVEESTTRRGEKTSSLGEKACLVCVTKAKAFQEF